MILAILFFLAFSIVGVSLIVSGFGISSNYKGMTYWEMVEGQISRVRYKREWYEVGEELVVRDEFMISYEFETKGEKVQSNRISPSQTKISGTDNPFSNGLFTKNPQEFYNAIVANPKVSVWVNPKRPTDSVLINDAKSYVFKKTFGLVFIIWVVGIIMIMNINIDLADTIEVIEEKTQLEKEAFDKELKENEM